MPNTPKNRKERAEIREWEAMLAGGTKKDLRRELRLFRKENKELFANAEEAKRYIRFLQNKLK